MIKGIIFDLDETLIKLPVNYNKIQSELKILFNTTDNFSPLISTIISKANNESELIKKSFSIISKEELKAIESMQIIEGSLHIIKKIQSLKISIFLVTMQSKDVVTKVFERMKLSTNTFSKILTRDDIPDRLKQIKKILNVLTLNPQDVLVIGDRIHDMESAKKAGCPSILVNRELESKNYQFIQVKHIANLDIEKFLKTNCY